MVSICPECGNEKPTPKAKRCLSCRIRRGQESRTCTRCGFIMRNRTRNTGLCKPCYFVVRREGMNHCRDCGTTLKNIEARRCRACYVTYMKRGEPLFKANLVRGFSPKKFRALLSSSIFELNPRQLSAMTEGRVSASTILRWCHGTAIPTRDSWQIVADVLSLVPCVTCNGTGYVLDKQRSPFEEAS